MGSLGFDELMVVIVVAIIVFGKDLPSVARKAGGWYAKLKRHMSDIREELQRQIPAEELNPGLDKAIPLPGPDPTDPEYKGPFDPSRSANGDGTTPTGAPESESKPPDSRPSGGSGDAPRAGSD